MAKNAADYEAVITKVQAGQPLTTEQQEMAATLQNESGDRGNRYRTAVRNSSGGDGWGDFGAPH